MAGAALLALGLGSVCDGAVNSLLVFGDSLSDVGNIFTATGGTFPAAPYYQGRFSNGPIWVDTLASNLGVPATTPSLVLGSNFAFGGSRVNSPADFGGQTVPAFSTIAGGYALAVPAISPDTLVTIWIGSNDFLNAATTTPNPVAMAQSVQTAMTQLVAKGARQFALLNIAPIGNTPDVAAFGPLATAALNAGVQQYNSLLAGVAANVDALPGVSVAYVDTYALFEGIIASPASYGLTNLTSPALANPLGNPSEYLWWDTVHPTAVAHNALGLAVAQAIPEPTSVLPVLAAGVLLGSRRRR